MDLERGECAMRLSHVCLMIVIWRESMCKQIHLNVMDVGKVFLKNVSPTCNWDRKSWANAEVVHRNSTLQSSYLFLISGNSDIGVWWMCNISCNAMFVAAVWQYHRLSEHLVLLVFLDLLYCLRIFMAQLCAEFLNSTTWRGWQGGGFKQRMKRSRAAAAEQPKPSSTLAKLLLEKWCWGSMTLPTLQALASAAVQDGLDHEFFEVRLGQKNVVLFLNIRFFGCTCFLKFDPLWPSLFTHVSYSSPQSIPRFSQKS